MYSPVVGWLSVEEGVSGLVIDVYPSHAHAIRVSGVEYSGGMKRLLG